MVHPGNNPIVFFILVFLLPGVSHAADEGTASSSPGISIGGRIKLDSIYSSRVNAGVKDTNSSDIGFVPASIPVGGSGVDDKYTIDLRGSRLWSKWHVPFIQQDLNGYLEVDFLASKNSSSGKRLTGLPRLRHYYLDYRGFTLGQAYTTFFNVSSFPELNDVNGPVGGFVVRQHLLRYSHRFDWGEAIIAVEDSETILSNASGRRAPNDERYPDIVGKFVFSGDWGNWSLSWLLREIINRDVQAGARQDEKWGGAVNLSGRLQFLERDNMRFSLSYGNVMGRYLSFGAFSDGALDNSGKINLTTIIGANIAYQHWWTDTLRSNIALGTAHADNLADTVLPTENRQLFSSHVNLLWSPHRNTTVGVEWLYGYRQIENDDDGDMNRIQLTARYRF